ncbi:hypothetical protein ACFYMW_22405 [Streptomyces sp. NPDC006692]|uniref:hypothetical protein n=1 Tax=unclassified Streptomyces TaxID=2593676 RepID=UPI0036C04B11
MEQSFPALRLREMFRNVRDLRGVRLPAISRGSREPQPIYALILLPAAPEP